MINAVETIGEKPLGVASNPPPPPLYAQGLNVIFGYFPVVKNRWYKRDSFLIKRLSC